MTSLVIIITSGIFALIALVGVLDLAVHLVCKGARALRTPETLQARDSSAAQPPTQGIAA